MGCHAPQAEATENLQGHSVFATAEGIKLVFGHFAAGTVAKGFMAFFLGAFLLVAWTVYIIVTPTPAMGTWDCIHNTVAMAFGYNVYTPTPFGFKVWHPPGVPTGAASGVREMMGAAARWLFSAATGTAVATGATIVD